MSGISLVTHVAFLAMVTDGVVLAIETFACDGVASVAMSVTLARNAKSAVRSSMCSEMTRCAIFARGSLIVGWAATLFHCDGNIGILDQLFNGNIHGD